MRVRNAAFAYGDHTVFSGIDLDVLPRETLSILGPNGSGKSTLLRCLSGSLRLARGSITIGDADLAALDPPARARRVAILFQDHLPSFGFRVIDVVGMGRAPHLGSFGSPTAADMRVAERALERVGLLPLRDRPYTELSGGERQLVLLARTLAQEPEVILLDEPTAHLDFRNTAMSLDMIGSLAADGVAVVMTSHDPNHAFRLPGHVALMRRRGGIVSGRAAQVITDSALSELYGTDVAVVSAELPGGTPLRFCTPLARQDR